jgi:hypothetical protein
MFEMGALPREQPRYRVHGIATDVAQSHELVLMEQHPPRLPMAGTMNGCIPDLRNVYMTRETI